MNILNRKTRDLENKKYEKIQCDFQYITQLETTEIYIILVKELFKQHNVLAHLIHKIQLL